MNLKNNSMETVNEKSKPLISILFGFLSFPIGYALVWLLFLFGYGLEPGVIHSSFFPGLLFQVVNSGLPGFDQHYYMLGAATSATLLFFISIFGFSRLREPFNAILTVTGIVGTILIPFLECSLRAGLVWHDCFSILFYEVLILVAIMLCFLGLSSIGDSKENKAQREEEARLKKEKARIHYNNPVSEPCECCGKATTDRRYLRNKVQTGSEYTGYSTITRYTTYFLTVPLCKNCKTHVYAEKILSGSFFILGLLSFVYCLAVALRAAVLPVSEVSRFLMNLYRTSGPFFLISIILSGLFVSFAGNLLKSIIVYIWMKIGKGHESPKGCHYIGNDGTIMTWSGRIGKVLITSLLTFVIYFVITVIWMLITTKGHLGILFQF